MEFERIRRTRKVLVTVGEESFAVWYVPRRWDVALVEGHNALLEEEDAPPPPSTGSGDADPPQSPHFTEQKWGEGRGRERFIYTLARLLDDWEVTDGGERVAVSEDFLRQVDDLYLYAMYLTVRGDIEERNDAKNA